MTTVQIIALPITCAAAILAVLGAALSWRAGKRARWQRAHTFPIANGEVTVTDPMSEAEYEALKTRWLKEHGSPRAAHRVKELRPVSPVACSAFRPSAEPADSGLCAGCGMYDYKHREASDA